jgi:hypothetical protein
MIEAALEAAEAAEAPGAAEAPEAGKGEDKGWHKPVTSCHAYEPCMRHILRATVAYNLIMH